MLPFSRPADRHEAWFGQHYADLIGWAYQITGRNREQAEDLVHDLFVLFMATRPDLDGLDNVDGYLYISLRNLHLSNARRAARRQEMVVAYGDFDVLDHGSLGTSLRALHEQQAADLRVQFQHQLRAVWCYAQGRKSSSKAASVLTLRFFHGYHADEIALILRVSREAAYQLLRQARREARLFLDGDMSLEDEAGAKRDWPFNGLLDPPDLAMALHEAALRSDPHGTCLSDVAVQGLYPASDEGASVPVATLAHIVSCRACLTVVTRRLDLPPLADRHPLDSLGYGPDVKPPRDGSSGGLSGGAAAGGRARSRIRRQLDAGRRRLADLLAHAPKELRVSVNGVILSNQHVTSAVNRFTLRLTTPGADFLEVFSEQDVRLLLVNLVAPPSGPVEVKQSVAFNDGRRLDVRVSFAGATPVVHVFYADPTLSDVPVVAPAPPPSVPRRLSRMRRLWEGIGRIVRPRPDPLRWRLSRRGAFTALVAATTVAALLLNQLGQPVLSAAELLQKSSAVDAVWQADTRQAIRRTLEMEARSRETGATTRRRVDVWQSAARGVTVRRAYDERNQLVAGEWIAADGTRTIHRADAAPAGEPRVGGVEAWQLDPSASAFIRLVGDVNHAIATEERGRFHISFDNTAAAAGPALLSASLTLRDDWRAVEQRATVRTPDGTTDLTWIERTWTTRPASDVPSTAFDVDASFEARTTPAAAPVVVPPATAALELAALTALRRIDADLGEEVRVRRAEGRLHVTGVVASADRRAQIRAALADVQKHPAARLAIETVDDVHARASRGAATPMPLEPDAAQRPLVFGPQQIPTQEPIHAYLVASGTAVPQPDDIVRVANRFVQQSTRMRVHVWALRTLLDQIPAAEVARLDATARQQWRALIGAHGRGFATEAEALRAMMAPVFPDGAPTSEPSSQPPAQDDVQIRQAAVRFVKVAADLERHILAAFTMPTAGTAPSSLDARGFWGMFTRAVTVAAALVPSAERVHQPQP